MLCAYVMYLCLCAGKQVYTRKHPEVYSRTVGCCCCFPMFVTVGETHLAFQLVSCRLDTSHKTVTFQFAPDSDKPNVIAEKLVRCNGYVSFFSLYFSSSPYHLNEAFSFIPEVPVN